MNTPTVHGENRAQGKRKLHIPPGPGDPRDRCPGSRLYNLACSGKAENQSRTPFHRPTSCPLPCPGNRGSPPDLLTLNLLESDFSPLQFTNRRSRTLFTSPSIKNIATI